MATLLDLRPGESTAAASPTNAIMAAAQRAREERDRKAALEEQQNARANEALKLSQQQNQREAVSSQIAQQKAAREQAPKALGSDAVQWDSDDTKGKAWNELPQYARQHFWDAYPEAAGEAPTVWNESQRAATGNPNIGVPPIPTPQPGQTVERDSKGGISTRQVYTPPEQPANLGTGEEALRDMSPEEANMVRQIANYELPQTVLSRIPGAQKMRILARVDQYDPTFSANEYPARQALKTSLKAGNLAQNITAANTAVAHLNSLLEASKGLNNSSYPIYNRGTNFLSKQTGSPAVGNFDTARNAVVSELAKVFKGAGVVPQQEIDHWRDVLSADASPEQVKGAVREALNLMAGRFSAIEDQYQRGMGKPRDFSILNTKSRAILRKNGFDPDDLENATHGTAPQAPEAVVPGQPVLPPAANAPPTPVATPQASPAPQQKPRTVKQNGVIYVLGEDGAYH